MGAIAGMLGQRKDMDASVLMHHLRHRGTTKAGIWSNDAASLAATGLGAAGELPGPVEAVDGEQAAVFDGHLINKGELTNQLGSHGLSMGSTADLVLRLYGNFGMAALIKLEGHFSIAIVDGDTAILARDPIGVRPLYFGFSNGALLFASEIKALVDSCPAIRAIPPGSVLTSSQGIFPGPKHKPEPIMQGEADNWASRLAGLLEVAVADCVGSDTPVGVWLSGGVDSSVVAALAQKTHGSIQTFSAGLEGAPDLEYAERVARHIGARHRAHIYNKSEALQVLDEVIFHLESFDAPLVRSAIGNHFVAKLAADHVPFVFSGEGGDELFAGYAYQKEYESEVELTLSVQQAIADLHNTALQRVDRSAAAHRTRVGLPFLDPRVVRFALAMPSSLKIRGDQQIEKWPLRQALVDSLPGEIIWRGKTKFWEGAGGAEWLSLHAEEQISDSEFAEERNLGLDGRIRSKEELLYYRVFKSHFGNRVPLSEIGRTRHV
jgi:asparagine synthase (glutamine-hydrolysing)